MSAAQLASLFVGRWPDGTPVLRSPGGPAAAMSSGIAANAFAFSQAALAYQLAAGVPPDAAPPAPADPLGEICPHWAHIRKVNPRDDQTNLGDAFDTLVRRILRRGIPYGAPFPADSLIDDGVDRGLLFIAYQASIEQSFERVTMDWMNTIDRPSPRGHDPVLGQAAGNPTRQRLVSVQAGAAAARDLLIKDEWVIATGGGYFFSPSISAVCGRLAA